MPTRDPVTLVAPRTWFVTPSWVNVALFETDAGLVLVDAGFAADAATIHAAVRSVSDAPLHTVIFTHGHVDHAFGLRAFLDAGERPRIVAHENVATRFRRYARTADYNTRVNATQFSLDPADVHWPRDDTHFPWPDLTYRDTLVLDIGGEAFHLHHARGETDDATWVWVPGRTVLACGDFWLNVAPNCGNPQKVQRYPEDWADAAEAMAGLGAEVLLPGHDRFQVGAAHIRHLFTVQAEFLRSVVAQTVAGLNAGLTHDEIVEQVTIPEHLAAEPSLQPLYDRPEFIARNVIRQYGGWWNGRAADLLPAPADARAREVAALVGGVAVLVARARALADPTAPDHDLRLACHLAEWALAAAPTDADARACAADMFDARSASETSLMGKGIYSAAARRARARPD
ncbi:MAG: alkyl sulfatase dimerization domain-containing protein [Actinomycetota bacterium]